MQVGAVKAGHHACIRLLLDHGASLISCPKVILADCVESILEGVPALLSRYLAAGADPNLPDANGCTLLHIAAAEKCLLAVKMLVQAGANVLIKDRFGHAPIDTARLFKANNIVQFLQPAVDKALASSRVKRADNGPQMTIADMDEEPFERALKEGSDVVGSPWKPLAMAAQDPHSGNNPFSSSPRGPIQSEALGSFIASGKSGIKMDAMPMVSVMPKKLSDRSQSSIARMTTTSSMELNSTLESVIESAMLVRDSLPTPIPPYEVKPPDDREVSFNSHGPRVRKYVESLEGEEGQVKERSSGQP